MYGHPKWVLLKDGTIRLANNVGFHSEMHKDKNQIVGGGWWKWDREKNICYLYKSSEDFGQCTPEQLKGAVLKRWRSKETKFMLSHYYDLEKAIENAIPIHLIIE